MVAKNATSGLRAGKKATALFTQSAMVMLICYANQLVLNRNGA